MTMRATFLIFSLILFLYYCNSIEPPDNNGNGQDTTSHNFTWQSWTFGEHSSSVLNDVVIIDPSNIWTVGEIYLNDSLGQPDPQRYNLAVWHGNDWSIIRVPYYFQGQPFYHPLQSVFAFDHNDIWLCGNGVIHWNGSEFTEMPIHSSVWGSSQMNKIWGTSSNDLYVVGNNGNIAHYNGTSWQRIESGTDLHLYDIYGDYSEIDGTYEILVTAANRSVSFDKEILKISNTTIVTSLVAEGIPYSIIGIWFKANKKYYVCGAGLFSKSNIETNEAWEELTVSNVYLESIDGNELNDIVICGSFGELLHYNGVSWMSYDDMPGGSLLLSTKIKDDLVVTVGINNPKAFVALGRR